MAQGGKKGWLMFLIYYLAYSAIYLARLNFSVASVLFEEMGTLTKAQIGAIGSVFALTYAIAKLPSGYIGDRLSARFMIVCGLVVTGLSNIAVGFFPGFISIAILWGLNACGQSMLWGPMLRTLAERYGEEKAKQISQYLVSSVAAGSILGLLVASFVSTAWGAAACFTIPGAVSLVMAAAVWMLFARSESPKRECTPGASSHLSIGQILKNVEFQRVVLPAIAHGMIKDNVNVWLAVYLVDTFGIDLKSMAGYVFFVPLLAFAGRMMYPLFYRLMRNESHVCALAFALCAAATIPLCLGCGYAVVAMLCLGLISAMVSVINTHMLSVFPARFASQSSVSFVASLMDVLTYGGAGVGSLIFGSLIAGFGYGGMFLIWGVMSIISIAILTLSDIREKRRIYSADCSQDLREIEKT